MAAHPAVALPWDPSQCLPCPGYPHLLRSSPDMLIPVVALHFWEAHSRGLNISLSVPPETPKLPHYPGMCSGKRREAHRRYIHNTTLMCDPVQTEPFIP